MKRSNPLDSVVRTAARATNAASRLVLVSLATAMSACVSGEEAADPPSVSEATEHSVAAEPVPDLVPEGAVAGEPLVLGSDSWSRRAEPGDTESASEGTVARYWYRDRDQDGFGTGVSRLKAVEPPAGYVARRGDCNDTDPTVYPGADDPAVNPADQDCGGTGGPDPHVGLSSSSFPSIQKAVLAAGDDTIVWVGPGVYYEHDIVLDGKVLTLTSTDGPLSTVIDAQGAGRLLELSAGESLDTVISGFTLTGGDAGEDPGGGIKIYHSGATLEELILKDNSSGRGGAVSIDHGDVIIDECVVDNNRAPYWGGGIYAYESRLTVTRSVITNNQDTGLWALTSTCAVENSIVAGNVESGLSLLSTEAWIVSSTVTENVTDLYWGAILVNGGGVRIYGSIVAFNIGPEIWVSEDEPEPEVLYSNVYDTAGKLGNFQPLDPSNVSVDPVFWAQTVDGVYAGDDYHLAPSSPLLDAGLPTVEDPDGSIAQMGAYGGPDADWSDLEDLDQDGLPLGWEVVHGTDPETDDADWDMDNDGATNFEEYLIGADPGNPDTDGDGFQDGEEIESGADPRKWSSQPGVEGIPILKVPGDYPTIGRALNAIGDAGIVEVGAGDWRGSYVVDRKNVTLVSVHGKDRTFLHGTRGPVISGSETTLVARGFTFSGGPVGTSGISLVLSKADVSDLAFVGNRCRWCGAAGFYVSHSDFRVESCDFERNSGGGLAAWESDGTILRSTFRHNNAENGAGLSFWGNGTVSEVLVEDNHARLKGGGALLAGNINMSNSRFVRNTANRKGGGIYGCPVYGRFENVLVTDNLSVVRGGGLCLLDSEVELSNAVFLRNRSFLRGGAIEVFRSDIQIAGILMAGNWASEAGGGVYVDGSTCEMHNVAISGNIANRVGGGLYVVDSDFTLWNGTVVNSHAVRGGGAFLETSHVRINSTILAYNGAHNVWANNLFSLYFAYSDLYTPGYRRSHNLGKLDSTSMEVEPEFLAYGKNGAPVDIHLSLDSPLVDKGQVDQYVHDGDGSRIDMGYFGGPGGGELDLDLDGYPGYFWPGTFEDCPIGFYCTNYDRDDLNPNVH